MSFDRKVSLLIDDTTSVVVVVSFVEREDAPDELRVSIRRSPFADPEAEAVWHVRDQNGGFTLQITTQSVVTTGICLTGCLAGIVSGAGPLVDCLKKAKNRREVRQCIDRNAVAQVVSALGCIYGCLSV